MSPISSKYQNILAWNKAVEMYFLIFLLKVKYFTASDKFFTMILLPLLLVIDITTSDGQHSYFYS